MVRRKYISTRKQSLISQQGFTIVELLIVVVVIGILAAITMVAYNGIQQSAGIAVLKSDLKQAHTQLELDRVKSGGYPASLAMANGGAGLSASPDTNYEYTNLGSDYYLTASSNQAKTSFHISSNGVIVDGPYSGHTGYVGGSQPLVNGGVVSTLAGSTAGYTDSTGASAQFNAPYGVAVDSAGTVYVADSSNNLIRKITTSGVTTTLAGSGIAGYTDGTGTSAQFDYPSGVAVDTSGNVYVADQNNDRIRKVTAGGVVTTLAGGTHGYADGTETSAQFAYPWGVAVDTSGNVYVADYYNHRIRKVTAGGVVTTLAGSGVGGYADGTGTSAQFFYPVGVTVDNAGNVYVADPANYLIRKITSGGVVTTLAGSTAGFADGTGTSAKFDYPSGITVDTSGTVYVADSNNQRIRKITASGVVTTLAGSATYGYVDSTGTSAQFADPVGVTVNSSGTIYVADEGNNRIRKIQ